MLTGLGKVLENVDFIGQTINFRIDRSSSIKTSCGGVSSMIIMFFLFSIFWLFVKPFMNREDPDIMYIYMKEIFPKQINLTNQNFFLGYTLEYPNGESLSDEENNLIKVDMRNFYRLSNIDGKKNTNFPKFDNKKMNFTKCNDDKDVFNEIKKVYENANPEFTVPCPGMNFINFDKIPDVPYYLEGSQLNNNYSYFEMELNINRDNINKMPNKTQVLEKFKYLQMKIYYSNVFINVEGNNYTAVFFMSFSDVKIGTNNYISGSVSFIQNDILEDTNYLVTDTTGDQKHYLLHDDSRYSTDNYPDLSILSKIKQYKNPDDFWNSNETLSLTKFKFTKTKNTYKYIIKYKKLPFLIAQSGGVLNSIVVFIKISASLLMDFQFYSKILQLTLDIDFNSTKISEEDMKENKVNASKQGGGERLKKLFSEINFIHLDKKKTSLDKTNKNYLNSSRKINDQTDLELKPYNDSFQNNRDNMINFGSPPDDKFNKKDEILEQNHQINLKKNNKNTLDGDSQTSEIMDADRANKFNSYLIAAEKAKKVNDKMKKKAKKKDDVFFKDDVFNFIDFVYGVYKYCSQSKIQPIGYIKILENRNFLFEKSKNNFYRNFEVNNIIKKNIEIDLIKFLLMSSDQLNLYRLVKKPLISFKNTDLSAFDKAYDEFSQDRLYSKDELRNLEASKKEDIKKSFLNIYEKKQSNVLNRKLLRMVEDRISLFLDE